MSEPAMALGGARSSGDVEILELPVRGMITLKADLDAPETGAAVHAATGCVMPGRRRIVVEGDRAAAWMAPDEVFLMVPFSEKDQALAALAGHLDGEHHLAADMSDARSVFRLEGPAAREVLAKLCPVDMDPAAIGPGEMRRTRLAQIPAAFWLDTGGATLVCFRSVARYAFDLLAQASAEGGEVGFFA